MALGGGLAGAVLLVGSGRVARTDWSSDRMRIGCEWVVCSPGMAISVAYTPGVGGQCAHRTDEHQAGSRVLVRAGPPGSASVGRLRGCGSGPVLSSCVSGGPRWACPAGGFAGAAGVWECACPVGWSCCVVCVVGLVAVLFVGGVGQVDA